MNSTPFLRLFRLFPAVILLLGGMAKAQDLALSMLLIDGEGWELMADGYGFTDGPCADEQGNFYFADVSKGSSVNRITPDGKVEIFLADTPKISGLKWGPNGALYAVCQAPDKQLLRFEKDGKRTILATNVQPNDLAVTRKGWVFFTETAKHQVSSISPAGVISAADTGINAPNGLTLSPDQGTLVVSDFNGVNLWAMRVESDGKLSHKEAYMTTRPRAGSSASKSDGMTTDSVGRYYVATEEGVQVFDPIGRMCGVIPKPQPKFMANLAFAGKNLSYLYVTCSDRIYRRKTQAKGVLSHKF